MWKALCDYIYDTCLLKVLGTRSLDGFCECSRKLRAAHSLVRTVAKELFSQNPEVPDGARVCPQLECVRPAICNGLEIFDVCRFALSSVWGHVSQELHTI